MVGVKDFLSLSPTGFMTPPLSIRSPTSLPSTTFHTNAGPRFPRRSNSEEHPRSHTSLWNLWNLSLSSTQLLQSRDELLEMHSLFAKLKQKYSRAIDVLNQYPEGLTEKQVKTLGEVEIKSKYDLTTLWAMLIRITTVSKVVHLFPTTTGEHPETQLMRTARHLLAKSNAEISPKKKKSFPTLQFAQLAQRDKSLKCNVFRQLTTAFQVSAWTPCTTQEELDHRIVFVTQEVIGPVRCEMVVHIAQTVLGVYAEHLA